MREGKTLLPPCVHVEKVGHDRRGACPLRRPALSLFLHPHSHLCANGHANAGVRTTRGDAGTSLPPFAHASSTHRRGPSYTATPTHVQGNAQGVRPTFFLPPASTHTPYAHQDTLCTCRGSKGAGIFAIPAHLTWPTQTFTERGSFLQFPVYRLGACLLLLSSPCLIACELSKHRTSMNHEVRNMWSVSSLVHRVLTRFLFSIPSP